MDFSQKLTTKYPFCYVFQFPSFFLLLLILHRTSRDKIFCSVVIETAKFVDIYTSIYFNLPLVLYFPLFYSIVHCFFQLPTYPVLTKKQWAKARCLWYSTPLDSRSSMFQRVIQELTFLYCKNPDFQFIKCIRQFQQTTTQRY